MVFFRGWSSLVLLLLIWLTDFGLLLPLSISNINTNKKMIISYTTAARSIYANPSRSDRLRRLLLEDEPRWRTNVTVCWSWVLYHGVLRSLQIRIGLGFVEWIGKKDDNSEWSKSVTKKGKTRHSNRMWKVNQKIHLTYSTIFINSFTWETNKFHLKIESKMIAIPITFLWVARVRGQNDFQTVTYIIHYLFWDIDDSSEVC